MLLTLILHPAHADEPAAAPKLALPAPEPSVLLQVWATAYDADDDPTADPAGYGDPEDDMGVKIRRARLGFTGHDDTWRYSMIFGVSSPFDAVVGEGDTDIQIVDAHAGYAPVKDLWIIAGVQKLPISREAIMSSSRLVLAERSPGSNWMFSPREAGVLVEGRTGSKKVYGHFSAGAFNGSGSIFGDDNTGELFAGRAELVSGTENPYRTFGVAETLTVAIAADGWLDQDIATTTIGYGGDFILRTGGLALLAEGRMSTLSPSATDLDLPGVLSDTARRAGLVQVGYTVGRYEPAVRVGYFDDDADVEDNGDVADVVGGLSWHGPQDKVILGGSFTHRLELGGVEANNDTARLWMQLRI